MRITRFRWVILGLVLLALVFFSAFLGSSELSFINYLHIFLHPPFLTASLEFSSVPDYIIVWQLRMPRIFLALLAGSALAVTGASYQSLFRNALTDPYILGVSSGASLGAAIAILLGLNAQFFGIASCAFVSALLTVFFVFKFASLGSKTESSVLLLTGVCINFFIAAIISFIFVFKKEKMEAIIFWTMGSLASTTWADVLLVAPFILFGVGLILLQARNLNILSLGNEEAASLGVSVPRLNRLLFFVTSLMVALVVSTCGVVGFVGLIVPHLVRMIIGTDNRKLIPLCVFFGAIIMLLADTTARTIFRPSELPVGSLTAILGVPFFIYLLYRAKQCN